ncbi:MAG: hypothetical protein HQK72_17670 [Desulfamplus sp.]|nr:hypothetical protein [Desulfamplus sp.]
MVITDEIREILTELINTGVGRAAKTLNELLQYEIMLSLPQIKVFDLKDMQDELTSREQGTFVNVVQEFDGAMEGAGILSFPVVNGKTFINTLLSKDEGDEEADCDFSVTELEAICEVGNNIINAVQGTISNMVPAESNYHLPETVISQYIVPREKLKKNEIYLFGEVFFNVKGIDIEGVILLIYAYKNIELIMDNYLDLLR